MSTARRLRRTFILSNPMLKITVAGRYIFNLDENAHAGHDIAEIREGGFHVLKPACRTGRDTVSYNAEVVRADFAHKSFTVKVNGKLLEVKVQDKFDLLLQQLGLGQANGTQPKDLKAPMPGLILDIKVTDGQAVLKGDVVIILEAMKMENAIKAPADGIVKAVKVKTGDNVEKNQVLIVF